ncbi:ABC transporter involved in cytochrome c biogenesis, CcmB subunit [hydrothermal vent metagenome]|uniref:Heme exporter protein B n=1 Tax=hydrothermal vent metagenome TaxID=652676 RepID=A0A3B0VQZ9_9ZZZZ
MHKMLWKLFSRDMALFMHRKQDVVTVLGFFLVAVALFPLGISSDPDLLRTIAPGAIWIAALFSTVLALDRLFSEDLDDGTLEQQLLMPVPISLLLLVRLIAHWMITGLPIVLLAPLMGLQFGLVFNEIVVLTLSLLIGTPILVLLGAIGAALTVGLKSSGGLVTLLLLPLYVPILILGTSAVTSVMNDMGVTAHFSLMGAAFIVSLVLSPFAVATALKITLD